MQPSSPDTAAGPPRIQTVFRFVEPNGGGIFPEMLCVGQVNRGLLRLWKTEGTNDYAEEKQQAGGRQPKPFEVPKG